MRYTVTNKADNLPITLSEAKSYLKVDHDDDDTLIDQLTRAATEFVESTLGYALITQTIKAVYDDWEIVLPLSNVQSVTSVKYYDVDNTQQTWASSNYLIDSDGKPNCITKKTSVSWPTLYDRPSAVEVIYIAGYGDDSGDVRQEDKIAIYKTLADWYEMREDRPWEKVTAARYLMRKNAVWQF